MTRSLHDRLRVLTLGIRPSVAAGCGVEPRGTVDLLDAQGIRGWQVGVRLILDEAVRSGEADAPVVAWARAELRADLHRWRYLASFVETLRGAMADHAADEAADGHDTMHFWQGWQRNIAYAHELLSTGLAVSPESVVALERLSRAVPPDLVAGTAPKHIAHLLTTAVALADPGFGTPPPLVLPEHRATLVAILTEPSMA